jgi:hypothetical protein
MVLAAPDSAGWGSAQGAVEIRLYLGSRIRYCLLGASYEPCGDVETNEIVIRAGASKRPAVRGWSSPLRPSDDAVNVGLHDLYLEAVLAGASAEARTCLMASGTLTFTCGAWAELGTTVIAANQTARAVVQLLLLAATGVASSDTIQRELPAALLRAYEGNRWP